MSEDETELHRIVSEAVADGIKQALSDPALWSDALNAMRKRAATGTGNLILDVLWGVTKRVALFIALALGLYWFGGIPALVAVGKSILGIGSAT